MKLTIVLAAGLAAGANAFRAAPRRRLRVTCAAAVEGGRVARVDLGVEDVAKARGFYEACGLTGESALGFGPADGHAALGLQDGVADAGDGFRGLVLHLAEAESVADAAANAGGAVVAPLEDKEIGPSLVPDEPVDKTTLITVGQLSDPSSNPVTLLRKRRRDGLAGVALRVLDLQETTAFWEGALGMVLLRQRSNVPDEASMSSFMGAAALTRTRSRTRSLILTLTLTLILTLSLSLTRTLTLTPTPRLRRRRRVR
mmetsp:Transcript_30299/g.96649  ORF Transcript_30299/g.96649 Transcript_30299/m.96649 type:complete len:257 (-) Transcript_30299:335-1105(-)